MIIGTIKEKKKFENRVAISPEEVKSYLKSGHQVFIERGAGSLSGFTDKSYKEAGATISNSKDILKTSDIVIKINCPTPDESRLINNKSMVVSQISTQNNQDSIKILNSRKVSAFALELVPRITRAQDMDILSSQANLAGYHAVIDAAQEFNRVLPLFMTAAGKVTPANVLVIGAGVAGLQAIATAKRLGAIVYATDVRIASKEQVESLGGKFVMVEDEESKNAETKGGYAKEMSAEYQKKQEALLAETLKTMDIVICTAQIPGRKAPLILKKEMLENMQNGSVIVDLAVESGGNCEFSQVGKVVSKNGLKIVGHANVPGRVANNASSLFSKNISNFLKLMNFEDKKKSMINKSDEIIKATMICSAGKILIK
ncbi:Re/Si-specific NAD(P)(+) transhydrogenase subunit alpha [Alphaproteobacteria bacterium]|jgi:NAD(P) transhydrogenase subunit alpha|nr:Re/Si-specific NAD(P)(+) transhydrogenase subunit alpha [Alphaproteobacteria bacterium]MDC3173417.1 Re/Si-specific NAD(P)(+) transhydrogenase subunit alpha [Alphaproteobacteria bacterium]|tara:strand:+ start:1858 stop:2973 length:1116 start_codon:yes stop_codon:yes gene_type:complete